MIDDKYKSQCREDLIRLFEALWTQTCRVINSNSPPLSEACSSKDQTPVPKWSTFKTSSTLTFSKLPANSAKTNSKRPLCKLLTINAHIYFAMSAYFSISSISSTPWRTYDVLKKAVLRKWLLNAKAIKICLKNSKKSIIGSNFGSKLSIIRI